MSNVTHREPTRMGLAGLPALPPDETPRDGRAGLTLESNRVPATNPTADALSVLQAENAELRRRVEELEHVLLQSGNSDEAAAEFELLLEQKSQTIRELHQQLQGLREEVAAPASEAGQAPESSSAPRSGPSNEECLTLQRQEERRRLDEGRQQLKDDEEALMRQMREMELSLSRDRADLARQRTELQRLQCDLNRELEQAGRDAGLRERLLGLRRSAENLGTPPPASPAAPPANSPEREAAPRKSGLLRRLFGG